MGGLSVESGSEKTVWVPCNCCVEKRNGVIFLDFHGKTNSRLLTVQMLTWSRSKNAKVSSTYRFASRVCYRLFLPFHVDVSYYRRNRASHSCSVLLFINLPVVLEICQS